MTLFKIVITIASIAASLFLLKALVDMWSLK